MIERYASKEINEIWSDENKLELWQKTELAVIEAMVELGQIVEEIHQKISQILESHPIDVNWWKEKDNEIKHDLNAFIEERLPFCRQNFSSISTKKLPPTTPKNLLSLQCSKRRLTW